MPLDPNLVPPEAGAYVRADAGWSKGRERSPTATNPQEDTAGAKGQGGRTAHAHGHLSLWPGE